MKHAVGICPACSDIVQSKPKQLFFTCPHCDETVSTHHARTFLDEACTDPAGVNNMLSLCISLEKEYGAEVPLQILEKLQSKHPHNESVAFTYVRVSGYRPDLARQYLKTFAPIKKAVPFAADFLDNTMEPANASCAPQFAQYIENKLPADKQKKYKEKLGQLKETYTGSSNSGDGMMLMYAFYVAGAVVNIALAVMFFLLPLDIRTMYKIGIHIVIMMAVFGIEMLVLFLHNRTYGNRIGIESRERLLLVIFLSSIMVAIGGAIIGALI